MTTSFITVRDLTRKTKDIFEKTQKDHVFIISKQGKPQCFLTDFHDFENFQKFKEMQRLQDMETSDIISEMQDFLENNSPKNIASMEEQLSNI